MYLVDTNVVSELRKAKSGKADSHVIAWVKQIPAGSLFLSVISILKIEMGILLRERRDPLQGQVLREWLENQVLPAFEDRVLAIDTAVDGDDKRR